MAIKKFFSPFSLVLLLSMWVGLSCLYQQRLDAGENPQTAAEEAAAQTGEQDEKHIDVDYDLSCKECHAEETPEIVQDWEAGKHGLVNVGCFVCHGDGEVEFYAKPGVARCIGCHSAYETDFEKTAGISSCFTCHTGHTLKFHKHDSAPGFGSLVPDKLPRQ